MNKDLPKWLQIGLVILLSAVVLLVLLSRDRLDAYGTYLRQKSPEINVNLAELSAAMDEAAVKKHFAGTALSCVAQPAGDALGDRVCYASIDKADGDAALMLAAFFRNGRLAHVMVQTPWWVHQSWHRRLTAQFGQPVKAGLVSRSGGPLVRWSLPDGYVESNRDRSFNPLNWNVVLWTGKTGQPPGP